MYARSSAKVKLYDLFVDRLVFISFKKKELLKRKFPRKCVFENHS